MTEAQTLTLTEFLLARIAEDEQRVRKYGVIGRGPQMPVVFTRLMAECEAKRRIVELHRPPAPPVLQTCAICCPDVPDAIYPERRYEEAWPCLTLRLLALPYSDHADYRAGWRP